MPIDDRPVVRVWVDDTSALPTGTWPMTVPAVAQVAAEGFEPGAGVTMLVGENGSGKSTLVEGLAGLYCLDEPEAALSFQSTLSLIRVLADVTRSGGQVVCATHSPVLAAMPGAQILEVGPWGLRESAWEDLELVRHWRAYLDAPDRYLRHLLG